MTLTPSPPKGELTRIRARDGLAAIPLFSPVTFPSVQVPACRLHRRLIHRGALHTVISHPHRPIPHPSPHFPLPKNLYISFLAASVRRPINSLCRARPVLPPTCSHPFGPPLFTPEKNRRPPYRSVFRTTWVFGSYRIRYVTAHRRERSLLDFESQFPVRLGQQARRHHDNERRGPAGPGNPGARGC